MEIQKLPEEVSSLVQSSAAIADATQCVLELVFNALDANSTSIAVRVNLKKFYVQVVDNGLGVTKRDLSKLGVRDMTNKCRNVEELDSIIETFGYRGNCLASIKDICEKLEIQTQHHLEKTTYTLTMARNGNEQMFENRTNRPVHGMTVTVTDFFCSLPVRRKRIKEVFDLDDIVHQIEALAAIHCHVSFSVRNDSVGKVLLQTHRHENPAEAFSELFGLLPSKQLIPISNGRGNIRVSGFVSKELHKNTDLQLVYVNRRIVHKSKIHRLLLYLMKKFGEFLVKDRNDSAEDVDVDGYIFIIKIACPYPSYTLSRNGRKASVEFQNIEEVLKCVRRAVTQTLESGRWESSLEDVAQERNELELIKGPGFGPSQLQNTVHGRRVMRESENLEIYKSHEVANVPDMFFREISASGSAMAENAPVYEIPDFPQLSFHDFLAWLQSQSLTDKKAAQFISEFTAMKSIISGVKPAPPPLASIKEIRKEKFTNMTKKMLKKMEESEQLKKQVRSENTLGRTRKIICRETTTYMRTPRWSELTPNIENVPQVSFGEFFAWMKYKANHDVTANQMMNEYFAMKNQGQQNRQLKRVNNFVDASRSKKLRMPLESKTPSYTESSRSFAAATSSKGIQCTIQKTLYTAENHTQQLYNTWQSHHHQPSPVRIPEKTKVKTLSLEQPKNATFHTPANANLVECLMEETENHPLSPVLMVRHEAVQACPLMKSAGIQTEAKPKKKLICASTQTDVLKINCDPNVGSSETIGDTVPVLTRGYEPFKEYFDTIPRYSDFKPSAASTKNSSFKKPDSPEISLPQEQAHQLQVLLTDSCEDYLASVKWAGCSVDLIEKQLAEIHRKAGAVVFEENIKSATLTKADRKTEAILSSVSFHIDDLETATLIGQVDRKFLALVITKFQNDDQSRILCLVDQHAAHERITLERLLKEYYRTGKIDKEDLDCAFPLTVSKPTLEIFKSEKHKFVDHGIAADVLGTTALLIRAVPACFLRRQERELKLQKSSLKRLVGDLVEELADHFKITRGAGIKTPKTIMNVVASEACRSSIKFNQSLAYDEILDMINQLKKCELPFQCAHGRPSIAPVFQLVDPVMPYRPMRGSYKKFKKN